MRWMNKECMQWVSQIDKCIEMKCFCCCAWASKRNAISSKYFTSDCNAPLCMFTLSSYWIVIFNVHYFPLGKLLEKSVLCYVFVCFFFRCLLSACVYVCMCFGFLILLSIKHTKDRWQRTHVCCRCIKSFEILLWLSCLVRVLSFCSSVTVSHTKYILVERARNNATCTDLTANVSKTRWVFSVWCARVRACVCGKHEFIFLTY